MKKYLLSGFFIFMFVFVSEISQALEPVDGECAMRTGLQDIDNNSDNNTYKTQMRPLCESGSFVLIHRNDAPLTNELTYACSGSFGGKSVQCHWHRIYKNVSNR